MLLICLYLVIQPDQLLMLAEYTKFCNRWKILKIEKPAFDIPGLQIPLQGFCLRILAGQPDQGNTQPQLRNI